MIYLIGLVIMLAGFVIIFNSQIIPIKGYYKECLSDFLKCIVAAVIFFILGCIFILPFLNCAFMIFEAFGKLFSAFENWNYARHYERNKEMNDRENTIEGWMYDSSIELPPITGDHFISDFNAPEYCIHYNNRTYFNCSTCARRGTNNCRYIL